MYAVIKTGGKQYRVAPEDVLTVEKLPGEAGETVLFDTVLMVAGENGITLGEPLVGGASVAAAIIEQARARKIKVFKKKRRKHYRRTKGHRQHFTRVRITEILTDGRAPSPDKAAKKAPASQDAPQGAAKAGDQAAAAGGDDLKKISGVGPSLEKKLHGLGVTSYAQIAAWTPEEAARIDEELQFKGRIEREDWIAQAKALAEETKED